MVSMDVEHSDLEVRMALWEKITALKSIIKEEFLPDALFEDCFILENTKEISRMYVSKEQVSLHNKNTWQETMVFLSASMNALESFFTTYRDYLDG